MEQRTKDRAAGIVLSLLVPVLGAAGLFWFWTQGRYGVTPSDWAWAAGGFGAIGISFWIANLIAKRLGHAGEDPAWNGILYIATVLSLAGLGGAWFWVRAQHDPLADVLGPACRGQGVAAAADAGSPPLRILVLGKDGAGVRWSRTAAPWRAARAEDASLVACVDQHRTLVETCRYTGGAQVLRYADEVSVRVVTARTGRQLGSFDLSAQPSECSKQIPPSANGDLVGEVGFDELSARLASYAAGGSG